LDKIKITLYKKQKFPTTPPPPPIVKSQKIPKNDKFSPEPKLREIFEGLGLPI
jgi:hypothetical protein